MTYFYLGALPFSCFQFGGLVCFGLFLLVWHFHHNNSVLLFSITERHKTMVIQPKDSLGTENWANEKICFCKHLMSCRKRVKYKSDNIHFKHSFNKSWYVLHQCLTEKPFNGKSTNEKIYIKQKVYCFILDSEVISSNSQWKTIE